MREFIDLKKPLDESVGQQMADWANGGATKQEPPHEQEPFSEGDDPTTPYRMKLRGLSTTQEINAWFRTVPEELKQDVYQDYTTALKEAGKAKS